MTCFLLQLFSFPIFGQEKEQNWALSGYIKNLQTGIFQNHPAGDSYLQDNLIHNRLNFKWFPDEHWTFRAELRTRVFYGDVVLANRDFADLVDDANNDYFDLSLILFDGKSWVGHTMLDRLYVEYNKNDWEIRLGRQRINWGINTVWNPNDVFNAFAFTDFDYEERPGSDALTIKKYTGIASSVELAVNLADRLDETVIAGRWQLNQWNYDFQLIGGYMQDSWLLGAGWAGQINLIGFKGEWSYFLPIEEELPTSFALSLGFDYIFEKGLYLNLGYLYNSNGSLSDGIDNLFNFELSAQNLYPYRHAVFLQATTAISPLVSTGLAIIYSPVAVHPVFLNPSFTVSIANNWDLDLIGQLVFNDTSRAYTSPIQAIFLRTKFSF